MQVYNDHKDQQYSSYTDSLIAGEGPLGPTGQEAGWDLELVQMYQKLNPIQPATTVTLAYYNNCY
jgi:hypothetical protein